MKRYSWTQPICQWCYGIRFPGREATRLVASERETEKCVDCGRANRDGIYVRVDPATAAHPSLTEGG